MLLKVRRSGMRTIEEYMKLPYTVELNPDTDEGGFTVSIPALPGCVSVGETAEDAYRNIEDAKHESTATAFAALLFYIG